LNVFDLYFVILIN